MLAPGEWEQHEFASPSAPVAREKTHTTLASNATAQVSELPLDDSRMSRSLDELISRRVEFLTEYQNASYANDYAAFVAHVRDAEQQRLHRTDLTEAVSRNLFKLMAYKDEYEVARLYTNGAFKRQLEQQFEGDYTLTFHLAPPMFSKKNSRGELIKKEFGPWMMKAFGLLAKMKGLRGGRFDLFGYTEERKMERALIKEYLDSIEAILPEVNAGNYDLAVQIAEVPEMMRGYGHVKERNVHQARIDQAALLREFRNPLRILQVA